MRTTTRRNANVNVLVFAQCPVGRLAPKSLDFVHAVLDVVRSLHLIHFELMPGPSNSVNSASSNPSPCCCVCRDHGRVRRGVSISRALHHWCSVQSQQSGDRHSCQLPVKHAKLTAGEEYSWLHLRLRLRIFAATASSNPVRQRGGLHAHARVSELPFREGIDAPRRDRHCPLSAPHTPLNTRADRRLSELRVNAASGVPTMSTPRTNHRGTPSAYTLYTITGST